VEVILIKCFLIFFELKVLIFLYCDCVLLINFYIYYYLCLKIIIFYSIVKSLKLLNYYYLQKNYFMKKLNYLIK